jgi:putative transposase
MAKVHMKRGQTGLVFRTHGGKRQGAGRKSKRKHPGARHEARPEHDRRRPVHVTIRIVGSAGGLRCRDLYLALREATIVTAKRKNFRIVHMSIQRDHIHLIVEADDNAALSKGVQGFSISAARQINKAITERGGDRHTGKVIGDRFHAHPLTSPRAVRNTLAYVLNKLPSSRRGSGGCRADVEGRPVLERGGVHRLEGAGTRGGPVAAAADVSAIARLSTTHVVTPVLGPVPPADLGARGPRALAGR